MRARFDELPVCLVRRDSESNQIVRSTKASAFDLLYVCGVDYGSEQVLVGLFFRSVSIANAICPDGTSNKRVRNERNNVYANYRSNEGVRVSD